MFFRSFSLKESYFSTFLSLIVFSNQFSRCSRLFFFQKMTLGTKNNLFPAARFVTFARCEWSAIQQLECAKSLFKSSVVPEWRTTHSLNKSEILTLELLFLALTFFQKDLLDDFWFSKRRNVAKFRCDLSKSFYLRGGELAQDSAHNLS